MTYDKKMVEYCKNGKDGCFTVEQLKKHNCTQILLIISDNIPIQKQLEIFDDFSEHSKKLLVFNADNSK